METPRSKFVGRENGEHLRAATMPGSLYTDPAILETELERFFYSSWLNVGREDQVAHAGDFFTRDIGNESILVIRGRDDRVRAFYNVCRHRGTRVVGDADGHNLRSIVCPYHAWTYSPEGGLVGAPHMDGVEDFDRTEYGLHPIHLETWGGFVWVSLSDDPRPLRDEIGGFLARFDRFPISDLRLGAKRTYEADANWKILVENYQECYHCAPIHPDLNRITPFDTGEVGDYFIDGEKRSSFSGGYMVFAKDYQSMTWSGYTNRPALKGMNAEDLHRIYYYVVFPNLFFSLHPDFLMIHRTWPVTPGHSRIECEFYFDPETMARPDFDPSDAIDLWDLINRQDWAVCERTQKGMRSRAWKGGRYSREEPQVYDFDKYVTERLRAE